MHRFQLRRKSFTNYPQSTIDNLFLYSCSGILEAKALVPQLQFNMQLIAYTYCLEDLKSRSYFFDFNFANTVSTYQFPLLPKYSGNLKVALYFQFHCFECCPV